ncbi:hypothetical protein HYU07_04035 [Candidatus Woesearchaeota archaeon]|nr:hypothetical protein [Candidatus Woesearchaeota archaeon]
MDDEYQLVPDNELDMKYRPDQIPNYRALKEIEAIMQKSIPDGSWRGSWGLFVNGEMRAYNIHIDGLKNMTKEALEKKIPVLLVQFGAAQNIIIPEDN